MKENRFSLKDLLRPSKIKFTNIDTLDDTLNEENHTYHRTTTMKPIDINPIQDGSFSDRLMMKDSPFLKSVTHILQ